MMGYLRLKKLRRKPPPARIDQNKKKRKIHTGKARFLTNCLAERHPLLKQAIEETGLPVHIEDVATDIHDRVMPGHISVWVTGCDDLKLFWAAYRRLVTGQ